MRRIDVSELTQAERTRAILLVADVAARFPIDRVEAIFRSLSRGEVLIHAPLLEQRALPLSTTLLRSERIWAASIQLALRLALGEESAEHVIAYLGQRDAVFGLFIGVPFDAQSEEVPATVH